MASEDEFARIILEYMKMNMPVRKAELLVGLGVSDGRVAEHTAQLFLDGLGDMIVFTGGFGKITNHNQALTEAERFRDIALSKGVPNDKILLEKQAANSGQNIVLVQELLNGRRMNPTSVTFISKPYMERRIWATCKKQWSNKDTKIAVTSPNITYEDHFNEEIPKDMFINLMVGDLQRIKEYPKQGFQIPQEIPDTVWNAYEELIKLGYTDYVMN